MSNRVGSSLAHLERTLREALRGVLPIYRTTPATALHREAAIPPMEIVLEHKRASARLRATRLDSRHPVARRLFRARSVPLDTRLLRDSSSWLEGVEKVDPLTFPPWQTDNHPPTGLTICST